MVESKSGVTVVCFLLNGYELFNKACMYASIRSDKEGSVNAFLIAGPSSARCFTLLIGGLSKLNNGTGISGITGISLSYDLPLNLGINARYNKYVGISKDDGSVEFDYELLDSFNLNLYYSF